MRDTLVAYLRSIQACEAAIEWFDARLQPHEGLVVAWERCPMQMWMEWILEHWYQPRCTCAEHGGFDPNCAFGRIDNPSRETLRANFADDIACIAYYTGL